MSGGAGSSDRRVAASTSGDSGEELGEIDIVSSIRESVVDKH